VVPRPYDLLRPSASLTAEADFFLGVIRRHAGYAMSKGRFIPGCAEIPLFADGWDVGADAPVEWVREQKQWGWADDAYFNLPDRWVLANGASQQVLYRLLDGLSRVTGDPVPQAAAVASARFVLEEMQAPNGLLYWGGHQALDLRSGSRVWAQPEHELKAHFPAYDFLWSVNADATRRFLEACWGAHVMDWSTLEMNRHGSYDTPVPAQWDHGFVDPPVFEPSKGLSFISTGSDLIHSAVHLGALSGDPRPTAWAERMDGRYEKTRNVRTGLRGYQFTCYEEGDRAMMQLGPEFGEAAKEGTVLGRHQLRMVYGMAPIMVFQLNRRHPGKVNRLVGHALADLTAAARHVFDGETGLLSAMLTDGTRLNATDVKRLGYYKPAVFKPLPAEGRHLHAAVLGWSVGHDPKLWAYVRALARVAGLGEIGKESSAPRCLAENGTQNGWNADTLMAVIELGVETGDVSFLKQAAHIGRSLIAARFDGTVFRSVPGGSRARFDDPLPLALLHLVTALRGQPRPDDVPPAFAQFHGFHAGAGRVYDTTFLYGLPKDED